MFRLSLFVMLFALVPTPSPAQDWDGNLAGQVGDLNRFELKMLPKIQVGMTRNEVKQVLGRPQAIEGGLPKSSKSIIIDFPEQAGQMNNSTWFYFYPLLTSKVDEPKKTHYIVNGYEVSEDISDKYVGVESVYVHEGQVVYPESGKGYEFLKDVNLKIVQRDVKQTLVRTVPVRKVTKKFMPIVAVIFDKGTQVVAATKVFFKIQ